MPTPYDSTRPARRRVLDCTLSGDETPDDVFYHLTADDCRSAESDTA